MALVAVRLLTYATAMLLVGWSLFPLYAPPGVLPDSLRREGRAAAIGAAVLLALSILGWLLIEAAALNDPNDPLPLPGMVHVLLFKTGFGAVWIVQATAAVLLLGGLLAGASRRLVLLPAAVLLASEAGIGHAAAGSGLGGALRLGAMAVHLLAAGAWLGGLVPLGGLLAAVRPDGEGPSLAQASAALRGFSRMGYLAVGLILLSGAANTYFVATSVRAFSAAYASVLALKLVLAAFLLSLALANRSVLLPRLEEGGPPALDALAGLRQGVLLEQGLGLLILATVSLLGILPPSPG